MKIDINLTPTMNTGTKAELGRPNVVADVPLGADVPLPAQPSAAPDPENAAQSKFAYDHWGFAAAAKRASTRQATRELTPSLGDSTFKAVLAQDPAVQAMLKDRQAVIDSQSRLPGAQTPPFRSAGRLALHVVARGAGVDRLLASPVPTQHPVGSFSFNAYSWGYRDQFRREAKTAPKPAGPPVNPAAPPSDLKGGTASAIRNIVVAKSHAALDEARGESAAQAAGTHRQRRSALPAPAMSSDPVVLDITQSDDTGDAGYLQLLADGLDGWVDRAKAQSFASSPSRLLQAVFKHHRQTIPPGFESTQNVLALRDESLLDEAALLYHQLQGSDTPGNGSTAAPPVLEQLRARFLQALRPDWEKQQVLGKLFAPVQPTQTTAFFDGFSFRNALGKTFDELLSSVDITQFPMLQTLTPQQRHQFVQEKFREMGESTQYRVGTPEHSLASAVIRILKFQGRTVPASFESEQKLLGEFKRIESAWKPDGRDYPIHPRLMFALHLAQSSGVELTTTAKLRQTYDQQVVPRVGARVELNDVVPLRWMADHLARWNKDGVNPWDQRGPTAYTQALLSLFDTLHEASAANDPISAFATELRQAGVLHERLVGNDWRERAQALLNYAGERLLVASGTPPQFERSRAAAAILVANGMSEDEMDTPRHYVIAGDNSNISSNKYGDRVDEFLERADWGGLSGSYMNVGRGVRINPGAELQAAEESFNSKLTSHPWVLAKAKENLRMRAQPLGKGLLDGEAQRIAANFKAETESHRAWMRGLETWVNTVPVLGPIYNIEEGIRHKDAQQALLGVLFLGLDIFDLAAGAEPGAGKTGVGIRGISPRKNIHVENFQETAKKTNLPLNSVVDHPDAITLNAEPFDIGQVDANVPPAYRSLAQQVRNGKTDIQWQGYDLVHLRNENRVVPVEHRGGSYHEIDWHTTHRTRNAPLIHRDPMTGDFRSNGGLNGGVRPAAKLETEPEIFNVKVSDRLTSQQVVPLMASASDNSVRDFDAIFSKHFNIINPLGATSSFDAKVFYGKLYKDSASFRRIVNRYDSSNAAAGPWQISVGDRGVGWPKANTVWDQKIMYLSDDATLKQMKYMSADGVQAITPEQAYLHEMIHALTGAQDPDRVRDLLNRGPVVYLTDKILSEAGYGFKQQVMYRRENLSPDAPPHDTVEYHRDAAAQSMEVENQYLDKVLDAKLVPVAADTLVEGSKVEHRGTVSGVRKTLDEIHSADGRGINYREGFVGKFNQNFAMLKVIDVPPGVIDDRWKAVTDVYRRLYKKSRTFKDLFDRLPSRASLSGSTDPWKFVFNKEIATHELPTNRVAHGLNPATQKVYIFDDHTRYLTATGLKDVEFQRKLAYEMVCILTGGSKMKASDAYLNRGSEVFLTDKILEEAGFHFPEQIAAALASPSNPGSEATLRSYQTSARRSAATEDRYMKLNFLDLQRSRDHVPM